MKLRFYKYQGTGNDFIIIDNRRLGIGHQYQALFEKWCDRKFGIGADGIILLEDAEGYDFRMVYFNSDGRQSSMCGNGGRCVVAFARDKGIIDSRAHFIAIDGEHHAKIQNNWVELGMNDVIGIEGKESDYVLNTGSPHYVRFKNSTLSNCNLIEEAHAVRYGETFKKEGINFNLVFGDEKLIDVRTYERGVEDETLSCGTGVTAAAIANHMCTPSGVEIVQPISTLGGKLEVRFFKKNNKEFTNIELCGPAEFVFEGEISFTP